MSAWDVPGSLYSCNLCACVGMEKEVACSIFAVTFSSGCFSAEAPVPSNAQRRKDPSSSENMETQKDNLTSQHRQQLTGTVAVSVWCMMDHSLCPFSLPLVCFFFLQVWLKPYFKENCFVFRSNTSLQSCNFSRVALKRKKITSSCKRTVGYS